MPRSTKTTRVVSTASITISDLPEANGEMITVPVTVPTRGYIHRVTLLWGKSSAFSGGTNAGGAYLHTSGTAGQGTTLMTSAEAQTIIAQALINPDHSDTGGGQKALGSSLYVWCPALDFAAGMKNTASVSGASGGGPVGVYYDVSGDTLGPVAGTGTLFFTWINGSAQDFTTDALFVKLRFEIEPCP